MHWSGERYVIHLKCERVEQSEDETSAHNPKVAHVESQIIAKVTGMQGAVHQHNWTGPAPSRLRLK